MKRKAEKRVRYFHISYVLTPTFVKSARHVELCSRPAAMSQVSIRQVRSLFFHRQGETLTKLTLTRYSYFSHSSELAMSSWSTDGADALTPCGHCDNCTRPPEQVQKKDVTLETWQLLKITDYVTQDGASLTLKMLASLARGSGGGAYEVSRGGKGRGKEKEKVNMDLDAIAGGPVNLTQEVCGFFYVSRCFHSPFLFWKGNRISSGGYARTKVPAGELPPDGVPDAGVRGSWAAGAEVDPFDARDAGGDE